MPLQKISFEYDIPEGYRFKRFGRFKIGDDVIDENGNVVKATHDMTCRDWIIVEKIPEQEHVTDTMSLAGITANPTSSKHADLISALEQDIAQIKIMGEWFDVNQFECRIKPKTKTIEFRVYYTNDGLIKITHDYDPHNFKQWIGGWQEVEIEE